MTVIKCQTQNGIEVSYTDPNTKCFSGSHQTNGIINICIATVFFIMTLLYKIFIFPLRVSIANPIGRLDIFAFPLFHVLRTSLLYLLIALPTVNIIPY